MAAQTSAVRELLAVFGFGVDTKELQQGANKLDQFVGRVTKVGAAIAAAFAVRGLYDFADGQARVLRSITDTAGALGTSIDVVQQYRFAATAMGKDAEALTNTMAHLREQQLQAAHWGQEQMISFALARTSIRGAKGELKDAATLFGDVAEGISKLPTAARQAFVAQKLFGSQTAALLPLLKQGRAGFKQYIEMYQELGGGYSELTVQRSKEFQLAQAKLNLVLTNLKDKILLRLLPILSKMVEVGTRTIKWFRDLTKDSYALEVALGVLTVAATGFAIAMGIANAPLLLITAAILALIVVIDDLVTLFTGGESLLGHIIDRIYGKDAHVEQVRKVKEIWEAVVSAFKTLWEYVSKVWDFFKWIKEGNSEFADKIAKFIGEGKERLYTVGEGAKAAVSPASTTYAQAEIQKAAQARVNAQAQGLPAPPLTSIPKGVSRGEMEFYVQNAMRDLEPVTNEKFVERSYPAVAANPVAGEYGPGMQTGDIIVNVTPSPGMDERQLGEHAAKNVREVMKQERRAAAATLRRKPATAR